MDTARRPRPIETPAPFAGAFARLGIPSESWAHPPVFTVEEGHDIDAHIPGGHTKNLFLKDKRDGFWLVTALHETRIDLKALARRLEVGSLSFGKPERLSAFLGVLPGSVTPLGLIHDAERRVRPLLDAALFAHTRVNVHPLTNDKTTGLPPEGLELFLRDLGFTPSRIDFLAL